MLTEISMPVKQRHGFSLRQQRYESSA